jgi:riboflavin synthase
MFSGIVEEKGTVFRADEHRLVISCKSVLEDSPPGSSMAVNGVCLTVVDRDDGSLSFDVSDETLSRSEIGRLEPGDSVNLERPLTLVSRLGGHLVQGHVDAVGEVVGLEPAGDAGARLKLRLPPELLRFVVEKGSLAVDGVSLTVAEIRGDQVVIALIPHTMHATTLGQLRRGGRVNLEVDVLAKYVERMMEAR